MPEVTTLTFDPGETLATLDVSIVDDDVNELPEFFTAMLSNPSQGTELGSASTATINIADDDRKLYSLIDNHSMNLTSLPAYYNYLRNLLYYFGIWLSFLE